MQNLIGYTDMQIWAFYDTQILSKFDMQIFEYKSL